MTARPTLPPVFRPGGRSPRKWAGDLCRGAWCGTLLLAGAASASADEIGALVKNGKATLDLRYRYENVRQAGFAERAQASTLRARLGYESGRYQGFYAAAELEALIAIGSEEYNSTANGRSGYPVVADPEDEEVNQAYLGFEARRGTALTLGRQRMTLDNHRFIGNVGWRQLEQTFDALAVRSTRVSRLELLYAYIARANRVFGAGNPDRNLARTRLKAHVGHASYETSMGRLTGYVHLFEFRDAPGASHRNLGARFQGKRRVATRLDVTYAGELADQSDFADGADTNDATYVSLEGGLARDKVTVTVGYEVLGGNGTYGFQTPFATLHAFNGWADKFLATPASGLEDLSVSIAGAVCGFQGQAAYHDFSAREGGAAYGTEFDVVISRTVAKRYTIAAKYADYDSDGFATDTEKIWLSLQAKY